jgi:calcineurin-like phosphoesterase family protein
MIFYTSDQHFHHKNMLKFEPESRPFKTVEEMDQALIDGWNSVVTPEDTVMVLGDFCFGTRDEVRALLGKLNGHKNLIIGNHDRWLDNPIGHGAIPSGLFGWLRPMAKIKDTGRDVILCHYPFAVWEKQHYGSYHVFGHIHSNKAGHHPLGVCQPNQFNAGVDVCELKPKTLDQLIEMNKR